MQEYFTLEEAARLLKYSKDQVFAVMDPGLPGATIAPAYVVGTQLDAEDRKTGKYCKVQPGAYEIGVFPFTTWIDGNKVTCRVLEWDKDGFAYVNELTSYEGYEQPLHISMALYPTEGSTRRRDLAYGKPEIIAGHEKKSPSDELECVSSPKNWMDGFSSEELAPIEGDSEEKDRSPTVTFDELEDEDTEDFDDEKVKREFIIWKNGWMRARSYILVGDPIRVARTQLVVLRWALAHYMEANGIEAPEELQEEFNAKAFVENYRRRQISEELIALGLHEQGLGNEEIGFLLPHSAWGEDPEKYPVTKAGITKHGERLWKRGKEIRDKA